MRRTVFIALVLGLSVLPALAGVPGLLPET